MFENSGALQVRGREGGKWDLCLGLGIFFSGVVSGSGSGVGGWVWWLKNGFWGDLG